MKRLLLLLGLLGAVIAPVDFRTGKTVAKADQLPAWTTKLYKALQARLAQLPTPTQP